MQISRVRPLHLALIVFLSLLLVWAPSGEMGAKASTDGIEPYATTITVNSTTDPDTSDGKTCVSDSPCTLRRAVIQARSASKPVLIAFNIPITDPGYNSTLKIWRIQFSGVSASGQAALRQLNGQITIDGTTQPNGRTTGPKIILVGPTGGQKDGIKLGETGAQNGNVLRGLGFQNFSTHVYVNSSANRIENNWFGLSDNGQQPYIRNNNPEDGSGNAGVALSSGGSGNTIQNNYFLGFDGVAVALRGQEAVLQDNYIGLNAAGKAPGKKSDPNLICTPVDWLGGGGVSLDGPRHNMQRNTIAGLRQEIFGASTQPDAITVGSTCTDCVVQNNKIGLDAQNQVIGVCGQGIDITNTKKVMLRENTLVNTANAAIFINGATSDANTLRGNIIRRSTPWALPNDDAIRRAPGLPDAFEFFNPAKVTSIKGKTVRGTSGDGSPCPNCIIELFLDDDDGINEALQSLGIATADSSGNWSFTLAAPLAAGHGIRTTSTTAQYNTIPRMNAGTTVGLSRLYTPGVRVFLPSITR